MLTGPFQNLYYVPTKNPASFQPLSSVFMAATECISSMKLDCETNVMDTEDSCPPIKKMKQGRLPFKPLDHAVQTMQGNTPPGSKKRKLSDNESPSAKQLKTGTLPLNAKALITDGEPEVSSSSEADIALDHLHLKKNVNTLDKFFKPKPYTPDQEEISSTNECIEEIHVDLTEECGQDKDQINLTSHDSEDTIKENVSLGNKKVFDENQKKEAVGEVVDEPLNDDKENQSDNEADGAESSFIANTSVCEDALKTPAKGKLPESVLKTPIVSSSPSTVTTPSQSQGSASDDTPVSGRKRKALSESKRKERELQREKVKEEKERQKEERRIQKEKEKEEKKKEILEKKRQKEEQKEKERLEKEKMKQEEKEKKEKERLEKVKQKEEEKKLKEKEQEAKLEEKRKKEEERKQKEEEKRQKEEQKLKEEEEKQRKEEKKKEMFKGFFIKKDPVVSPPKPKEIKNGLFMPFELKTNMKLAPVYRRNPLSDEAKDSFDELFSKQKNEQLYLKEMKSTVFTAGHYGKTWPKDLVEDDDVELLSHEKETIEKVTHHVKFLYFHENTRPPYYGTWRKRSKVLSGRNPFKQDENLFDYEVDSDDEWEEEEPGESVSSDEEEEEGEKMEDEGSDADEWMVPHGYLSDGEGVDDDDEVDAASKQDLQKVRQAAWESELKRQAKPLKMLAIGCAWEDDNTASIAAQQLETLLKFKAVCLTEGPIGTTFTGARSSEVDCNSAKAEKSEEKKHSQRKSVPEEAIPDLIRLVHGNPVGIKNLIKEFRMYWKKKTNPSVHTEESGNSTLDSSKLDMSMEVDENTDKLKTDIADTPKSTSDNKPESQDEFSISKRQLEMKIPAIATREKRADHKKVCWYVKEEILKQYDMVDIKLPNSWEYVCIKEPTWAQDKGTTPKVEEPANVQVLATGRATPNIMQFTQPMSPSQIQAQGLPNRNTPSKPPETAAVIEIPPEAAPSGTPGKPALPADQRSIKDIFSPTAKKALNNISNKNLACPALSKAPVSSAQNKVSPHVKKTSNDAEVAECHKLKEAIKTNNIQKSGLEPENQEEKVTPKASSSKSVLKSMLSSPELMKPQSHSRPEDLKETEEKEEPMDIDIIVLD